MKKQDTVLKTLSNWIDDIPTLHLYGSYGDGFVECIDLIEGWIKSLYEDEKNQIKKSYNIGGTDADRIDSEQFYNEQFNSDLNHD